MSKVLPVGVVSALILLSFASIAAAELSEPEQSMLDLVNEYRQENGLRPVTLAPKLGEAAQFHSAWMARNACFAHQCAGEPSLTDRMEDAGYNWYRGVGENIAAGSSSAARVFRMWRNSPAHNENMLDPRWRSAGVSLVYHRHAPYRWYWTLDFGARRDAYEAPERGASPRAASALSGTRALSFQLPAAEDVERARVEVFDLAGQRVFESGWTAPGALRWNLLGASGGRVANGVYFCLVTIQTSDGTQRGPLQKLAVLN